MVYVHFDAEGEQQTMKATMGQLLGLYSLNGAPITWQVLAHHPAQVETLLAQPTPALVSASGRRISGVAPV